MKGSIILKKKQPTTVGVDKKGRPPGTLVNLHQTTVDPRPENVLDKRTKRQYNHQSENDAKYLKQVQSQYSDPLERTTTITTTTTEKIPQTYHKN